MLKETQQLQVGDDDDDDDNLLNEEINTIKKNTETLLDTGDEVDLEVNAEKSTFLYFHQNTGQVCSIKTADRSLKIGRI
jgi:hypothetical protein